MYSTQARGERGERRRGGQRERKEEVEGRVEEKEKEREIWD